MKTRKLVNLVVSFFLLVITFLTPQPTQAQTGPTWQFVSVPDLPAGLVPGAIWSPAPNRVMVLFNRPLPQTRSMYESYLYFWTGKKWKVMLHMPGYAGQTLYGTGPKEVFLSVSGCDWVGQLDCQQTHPRMFRYDGLTWTEQSLPVAQTVGDVQGVPGFVLGSAFGYLLKYQNGTWSLDFQPNWVDTHAVWVFGPEEAYYVGCGGHGYWDGAWHEVYTGQWCDTSDMWGMYDENGLLHMVAVGNVTFSNAFRIWRYHPQTRSYTLELSEPVTPSFEAGSASRVWGFAPDDIYVVGRIGPWSNPIGRIYHYDGTAWNMVNDAGPLPVVNSVHGSGPTDVWFGLNDGRLLHFGDPLP